MAEPTPRKGKSRPDRWITNTIRLSGLLLVLHDYFTNPAGVAPDTLAAAAFVVSIAQGLDSFFESRR
jgi:hypothetical protein